MSLNIPFSNYYNNNYFYNESIIFNIIPCGDIPKCYLPSCRYGLNCYRKNPNHFISFSHNSNNSCYIKLSNITSSSYSSLQYSIKSNYNCNNINFIIKNSNNEIINDYNTLLSSIENFEDYFDYNNDNIPIIPLYIYFKNNILYTKQCSNCFSYISSLSHYYECYNCLPNKSYILCSLCENRNLDNSYHNKSHIMLKIYSHQQNHKIKEQKKEQDDKKLDIIINELSELKKEQKQSNKTDNIKPIIPILNEDDKIKRKQALQQLSDMGFKKSPNLCSIITKYNGNIDLILSEYLDKQ